MSASKCKFCGYQCTPKPNEDQEMCAQCGLDGLEIIESSSQEAKIFLGAALKSSELLMLPGQKQQTTTPKI